MCTKYKICGRQHTPRWKTSRIRRNHKGQFIQRPRILTAIFLGITLVVSGSIIGWNTIINSVGMALVVDNSRAEEIIYITWQDEIMSMLKKAGVDTEFATRMIQCESTWNPEAFHYNQGSIDRGLWQINSYFHPEVSKDCSYDPVCATREAIRIIKTKGWSEWSCYEKLR